MTTEKNTQLTFVSLFAGIGGFDLGFERAGMKAIAQVECDMNCRTILGLHWPDVELHDDVREYIPSPVPDVLCGGFPCQDLSVAGKRAGLAGERSGLFHEFARILAEVTPEWFVLENVPGLLSSNGGRDMGTVLGTLGQLGYGYAWRVLDAQYDGLAQRRKRVFIIGCAGGDARRAAEVLFEPESLRGDPPPSREAGARTAEAVAQRVDRGVNSEGHDGHLVADTLNSGGNDDGFRTKPGEHLVAFHARQDPITDDKVSLPLEAKGGQAIAHALTSEGHDASEGGNERLNPRTNQENSGVISAVRRLTPV